MMKKCMVLILLLAFFSGANSYAQNFDSVYGAGVHQFFRGCNSEAIQSFDAAIVTNPDDPRPYYFRGLAKMNCGDSYAAQADFRMGAQMEAIGNRRSSLVSRALERIQGNHRICIEQARQIALNPGLQTAQNAYVIPPYNAYFGQPSIPAALPPNDYPSQSQIEPNRAIASSLG